MPGHADVHDHDRRPAPEHQRDRALAVGGLADDADVRRAREREPEALADDLVVVDDQRRDLVRHVRGDCMRVGGSCRAAQSGISVSCSGGGGGASRTRRRSRTPCARASSRHERARRRGLGVREVRRRAVEPLVLGQELRPVAREALEEVLARARLQVQHVRPDAARAGLARRAHDRPRAAPARPRCPAGSAPCRPTRARRRRRAATSARSRWRGGAVPGSVRRQTSSSSVGTENVTETSARFAASASTSTSRTISGPRVISENGFAAAASASRQARVSR